ncbi:MAG: 50S ribosomal protein L6 [Candidatus Hodgkinia cicadicola]
MRTTIATVIYLSNDLSTFISLSAVFVKSQNGKLTLPNGIFIKSNCLVISKLTNGGGKSTIFNMMKGLKFNHVKWLVLRGSGFKATFDKQTLILKLGFSHCVQIAIPSGVLIDIYQNVKIRIIGVCLQQVTFVAQVVKSKRSPDAYKAKGISYRLDEIKTKAGKRR